MILSSLPYRKNKSSYELRRQECHWEYAVAKLDNSIMESSDQDVHPSKYSNKGSKTEPTNISEVKEKSGHQVPQFNCDQCIFQGASCKEIKHRTRLRQKIHHLDEKKVIVMLMKLNLQGLFVQMIQEQNSSWKKTNFKFEDCEYTTKGELYVVNHSAKLHNQFVESGLALPYS